MRILHLISQTPDFTGSGKYIREIIGRSGQNGHENFLVAGIQGEYKVPESLISEDHCIFVRFDGRDLAWPVPGMSDVMPYPSTVFSSLCQADMKMYRQAFTGKIREALEIFRPHILHTHHLWVVSALARSLAPHIPMVATCHGTCLRQHYLCPEVGRAITPDLAKIDRIIALSLDQKEKITAAIKVDPSRIHVIGGGYNEACFFYAPKVFEGTVELLYAGKLSAAKGVPWLLKSLERIMDRPFRLHLAGSSTGRELETCLALARNLGEKAIYHGPLSHEALGELMRCCHVFVLPSFFEGLPLVLMEALASGCRVVTTDLPGVREILGTGENHMVRLIPLPHLKTIDTPHPKDEESLEIRLAETLSRVMEEVMHKVEPDLDYIRSATAPYTWEKIYKKVEAVYTELVSAD
ncbi:MAG: glycosyltransferase family 4 protein [Desulfobacteraceae bacterium]|nr:glycosyltransferase family 4 protein [Desulfobacteraceae bacterium]